MRGWAMGLAAGAAALALTGADSSCNVGNSSATSNSPAADQKASSGASSSSGSAAPVTLLDVAGQGNAGVNELGAGRAGVQHFHSGGTLYLTVNSECGWHVTAVAA